MDYDTVELWVAAGLTLFLPLVLALAGVWSIKRQHLGWYFFAGILLSLSYGWLAGNLAIAVFPPPADAYFDSGRGLDLRGLIIFLGAMAGSAAGLVTTAVVCTVGLIRGAREAKRSPLG